MPSRIILISHAQNLAARGIIDSTGTVIIDGVTRAVQHCRFVNNLDNVEVFPLPFQIIEGAGMTRLPDPLDPTVPQCAYFFLDEYICKSPVDGVNSQLLCYKDDEIELAYVLHCDALLSSSDNPDSDKAFRIKLFPNPARDMFNIEFRDAFNNHLCLFRDAIGRIIGMQEIAGKSGRISTVGWASGMYFVEVSDKNNKIDYQRLIITK